MIKISEMSGKLEGFSVVNTNTLSNVFCQKMRKNKDNVCSKCYAANYLRTFRSRCVPAWERNSQELSSHILSEQEIPVINSQYCRFNAYGELINATHLLNLIQIAKRNSNTVFALWTKRTNLVNKHYDSIPSNVVLVYSSPKLNKQSRLPKHFHKVFTVFDYEYNDFNCSGHCKECLKCYDKGGVVFINEVLNKKHMQEG